MERNWIKKIIFLILIFVITGTVGCSPIFKNKNTNVTKGTLKSSTDAQKSSDKSSASGPETQKNLSDESSAVNENNSIDKNDSGKALPENNEASNTPVASKFNSSGIPVLMYHSVMYEKGNDLRIPKEKFYEQMKYLKDNGYTTLTLDELYDFIANNKPVPEKSIVITLDDGYVDNYTNAFPVLKEFGFKATVFVITCTVDKDAAYLTSSELKELEANGIQIEGHTVNHDELNKLNYTNQLKTLKDSKKFLDDLLNKDVKFMAYPFGKYNDDTIKAAKEAGYSMIFTTMGGWAHKSNGIMTLNRVYISSSASMDNFIYRITHSDYNK